MTLWTSTLIGPQEALGEQPVKVVFEHGDGSVSSLLAQKPSVSVKESSRITTVFHSSATPVPAPEPTAT